MHTRPFVTTLLNQFSLFCYSSHLTLQYVILQIWRFVITSAVWTTFIGFFRTVSTFMIDIYLNQTQYDHYSIPDKNNRCNRLDIGRGNHNAIYICHVSVI